MIIEITQNIKYKGNPIKIGEKLEITEEELEILKDYGIISESEAVDAVLTADKEDSNIVGYKDITVAQLVDILGQGGIEFDVNLKKADLYRIYEETFN